jgi:hypothetical protein
MRARFAVLAMSRSEALRVLKVSFCCRRFFFCLSSFSRPAKVGGQSSHFDKGGSGGSFPTSCQENSS